MTIPEWERIIRQNGAVTIVVQGYSFVCPLVQIKDTHVTIRSPLRGAHIEGLTVGSTVHVVLETAQPRPLTLYTQVVAENSQLHVPLLTLEFSSEQPVQRRNDVRVDVNLVPRRIVAYMPSWARTPMAMHQNSVASSAGDIALHNAGGTHNDPAFAWTATPATPVEHVPCAGRIINLSAGGFRLDCTLPLPRDVVMEIVLSLPVEQRPQPEPAHVPISRRRDDRFATRLLPPPVPAPKLSRLEPSGAISSTTLTLIATTVRSATLSDTPTYPYRVACRFGQMPQASHQALTHYVFREQLRHRKGV